MDKTIERPIRDAPEAEHSELGVLHDQIRHAAHLLPAQGPITAFVHHNTLHAFEHLAFETAVVQGAETFGCHPYLPENRYRAHLLRGRIRIADLEAVLIDDLGERADALLGFLGTRFHLRMAMLQYPLRTGPSAELRWVVSETDALREFRPEVPASVGEALVQATRQWIMRGLRGSGAANARPDLGNSHPGSSALGNSHPGSSALGNSHPGSSDLCNSRSGSSALGNSRPDGCRPDGARRGTNAPRSSSACDTGRSLESLTGPLFTRFDRGTIEHWSETTWRAFTLQLLWQTCREGVRRVAPASESGGGVRRHRDLLFEASGEDSDLLVHDELIRICAAFLDQGFSQWALPRREEGLLRAFLHYASQVAGPPDGWLRGLRKEARRLLEADREPLAVVGESLQCLGVTSGEQEAFVTQTLLALRGFAGMIWQTETRGDRVAHPLPAGSLVEFLAVRLLLERFALSHVARCSLGYRGPLSGLRQAAGERIGRRATSSVDQRAFLVFQLAQPLGWTPESLARLTDAEWGRLLREVESFSGLERRRVYHLAFERQYRNKTLDALAAHTQRSREATDGAADRAESERRGPARPRMQVICCIDDREESFRRHLEEVEPGCETLGAAGFFGVAMYYRGAATAHYSPLCPVVIQPRHFVQEEVVYTFEQTELRRRRRRQALGTMTRQVHLGSRTVAGGWLTAVLGSLASIPLVARILFPRLTARLGQLFEGVVRPPSATRLQLERSEATPGAGHGQIGYCVDEMAGIVESMLRAIGLTGNLSRLVIVVGHGSSGLNNPHEAAYHCGACGGGKGGPNARAFAEMANDSRVRERLARNGLRIPPDTYFVGAYHNTCDDQVTWYDLERVPSSHRLDLDAALEVFLEARERNAQERCRRFESAELSLEPAAALKHVEGRAEDLSQVRPECGHATNALCFVGRREWSKGLFLDRRAFLQSYDPRQDDEQRTLLTRILQAVIPVCAGINLEYYFSYVDPIGYGCGTKLPHNITSLLGVMNGAASDLRPGLPWQMVEIHEPMRLLFVIETTPEAIRQIVERDETIGRLVRGRWVQLATLDVDSSRIHLYRDGTFAPYRPGTADLPQVPSSMDWYRGWREHLDFARIVPGTSPSTTHHAFSTPGTFRGLRKA